VPACCWHNHMQHSQKPYRVLFMQSQTYYGADSRIHGVLMRHFDRRQADVHVALNYGDQGIRNQPLPRRWKKSPICIFALPILELQSTNAPVPKSCGIRSVLAGCSISAWHLWLNYIRKNQINIIHCTEKPRDAFYGYLLSRMTGAKCVIHLHVKAENWISKNVQWAMHRADALIGVSQFVADSMREMGFPLRKSSLLITALNWMSGSPM
jgi:hypothetical protein